VPGNDVKRLTGKRAVVTGAARGIGRAIATAFVDAGAEVILCDLLRDEVTALAQCLGNTTMPIGIDVTRASDWVC